MENTDGSAASPRAHQPLIVAPSTMAWRRRELPPRPDAGLVRIRTRTSLISSGTEMTLYRGEPTAGIVWDGMSDLTRFSPRTTLKVSGRSAASAARFPCSVGYNNVGEIVALGDGVEGLEVGQRVFTQARHSELFDAAAWEVVPIPDAISDAEAAPAYIATLGLHALRRMSWVPGEPVVVIGLGLIGLAAALMADALGAELILIGRSQARTQLAAKLLPDARVQDPSESQEDFVGSVAEAAPRVAVEAAGGPAALQLGLSVLGHGGRLTALGMHAEPLPPLLADDFYAREISLVGTSNDPYGPVDAEGFTTLGNVAFVLGLIGRGRLSFDGVCTDTFAAAEIAAAYAKIDSGETPEMVGVLLDWRSSTPFPEPTVGPEGQL
jgi:threonine dehydrogenase-like Zn-dependent dehydrogenase